MPLMDWDATLDIGVEEMNREHREILAAINAIYDGAHAGQFGEPMIARIARLADITVRHFADEERLMAREGFAQLETHKAIHRKLLTDFSAHQDAIAAMGGVPTNAFFSFLRLWLSAHIKCIDRKYAEHMQAGSAAAGPRISAPAGA
ncbi:hemerythrin family protein [Novosphingobium album (ex Liu et al. 2023)]|uniref:Hemerythrin family protein n=1 Tax=Novosphingobium album (ex Liu et al. 2023) TaxID=3031130 RepID=A0ABT5WJT5_9SPHN|nr:hemerythrin family protein [Novosphingobium album (ex Liu et al. 2023)]MDE8650310.1 hemerythrin family protein [Novosphingobium album (ex Liu et al. 2023)]